MAMTISEQNYINEAINRARGAYNNAIETSRRNAERMGLNPNSGKFSAMEQSAQFATAASAATAGNEASTGWLKTAQAQANEDEAMRYKYSALDLSRDEFEHKEWMDKTGIKMQVESARDYLKEEKKKEREEQQEVDGYINPRKFQDSRQLDPDYKEVSEARDIMRNQKELGLQKKRVVELALKKNKNW